MEFGSNLKKLKTSRKQFQQRSFQIRFQKRFPMTGIEFKKKTAEKFSKYILSYTLSYVERIKNFHRMQKRNNFPRVFLHSLFLRHPE